MISFEREPVLQYTNFHKSHSYPPESDDVEQWYFTGVGTNTSYRFFVSYVQKLNPFSFQDQFNNKRKAVNITANYWVFFCENSIPNPLVNPELINTTYPEK